MEGHTQDIIYAIGSIVITVSTIIGAMWKLLDAMEKRMNKRFDVMQEQLNQINQNHIDHLTNLHALPAHREETTARTV